MSDSPSPAQLVEAVRALRVSLLSYDPDAADDAEELSRRVRDDHFAWKRGADAAAVRGALDKVKAAERKPYTPPTAVFPQGELFSGARSRIGLDSAALPDAGALDVRGVHHAQGGLGSKGSYILAVGDSGIVVLKESSPEFLAEVFAACACRAADAALARLSRDPRRRLEAPHYRRMLKSEFVALTERLRDVRVTVPGTCGALHESRAQEGGAVLMDFVAGTVLPEATKESVLNPAVLRSLGCVAAVDMLTNNFDRTPLVWAHLGNASNILVRRDGVGCIDQAVTVISDEIMLDKYIANVRACVAEARAAGNGDDAGSGTGPHAQKLRAFLNKACQVDPSKEELCMVLQGIVDVLDSFTEADLRVAEADVLASFDCTSQVDKVAVGKLTAFCATLMRRVL